MGIESKSIAQIDAIKGSCVLVVCGSRRFSRRPMRLLLLKLAAASLHNWPIVCPFLIGSNACVSPFTSIESFTNVEQSFCRAEREWGAFPLFADREREGSGRPSSFPSSLSPRQGGGCPTPTRPLAVGSAARR